MPKHDFGIIEKFNPKTNSYEKYTPNKYDCISIDDELIRPLSESFLEMDVFFHTGKYPGKGLAYSGITLIPPESLQLFKNIIETSPNHDSMKGLIKKINKSMAENKFMIHYGI